MRTKATLAATLVLPLLLLACDRESDQSSTATGPSLEKQTQTQSPPDKMVENSPPSAGQPPPSPDQPSMKPRAPQDSAPSAPDSQPKQQREPKSG